MPLKAIFLGSLGTLAETTEMQRRALNAAFAEAGLDWDWAPEVHRGLVGRSRCCAERIAAYAAARNVTVDATAIQRRKTEILCEMLGQIRVAPRPGLKGLIRATHGAGLSLGLVATASPESVDAMLAAAGLNRETFAFVGDETLVAEPKPAPDIYVAALAALSLAPDEAIAIEDTPESAEAAIAAGVACVAFPGAAHVGKRFGAVAGHVDCLAPRLFDLPEQRVARRA